ncbi:MAG TPA: hypothetical protein VFB16_06770 [Bauldia sp.]|nr:hypothetical protein [Bauldia sp.]
MFSDDSVTSTCHMLGRQSDGWNERRGRATLVLQRMPGKGCICIHSRFSMEPGIPPRAD